MAAFLLVLAILLPTTASATTLHSSSWASKPKMALATSKNEVQYLSEMEKVFARSEEEHQASMGRISKNLALSDAAAVLHKKNDTNLNKMIGLVSGGHKLR